MNLRVELVHLNSSGFQIYKFNINLFYKSNSGVEGGAEGHPGSKKEGNSLSPPLMLFFNKITN